MKFNRCEKKIKAKIDSIRSDKVKRRLMEAYREKDKAVNKNVREDRRMLMEKAQKEHRTEST